MLFEGGLNLKAACATGVTVYLEECPENKTFKGGFMLVSPFCVWRRTNWPPTWSE